LFIKPFFKILAFVFVKVRTSSALVRTSVILKPLVRGQVHICEISPPETEAFIKVRRTCTKILIKEIKRGLLLNKGYHPMKFEGSSSKGTRVIEQKRISLFGSL